MSSFSSGDLSSSSSDALIELLSPDGYYKYLQIEKPSPTLVPSPETEEKDPSDASPFLNLPPIDEDLVKKNYRKLSRKHHPDKGGDADTFRLLNRAQKVLLNPKLRQQYDVLGIDLDDDEEEHEDHDDADHEEPKSTAQGIMQEIAKMALTSILSLMVRTVMMGAVAVVLVRYRITLYPALGFLAFVAFRLLQRARIEGGYDVLSPIIISFGLLLMHQQAEWSRWFWLGETIVIAIFTYNSVTAIPKTGPVMIAIVVFATLAALWFRGSWKNYAIAIGLEAIIAVLVALAFPVVEFVLEAILNDKLRKVGDKVRAHHKVIEKYYEAKIEELESKR